MQRWHNAGVHMYATHCMQHTEAGSHDGSGLFMLACPWLEGLLGSYFMMSFLCHHFPNNMISGLLPLHTLLCVCRLGHFGIHS